MISGCGATTTAWTVTGTGGPDEFHGGAEDDVFIITGGAPNGNLFVGNGGVDTVQGYTGASDTVAIQSGSWVVTDGTNTDTLTGIEKVVIGSQVYDLVDGLGANVGGFQTVAAAVATSDGDIIAQNTGGTAVIFFVEDTAAHIQSHFDALDALLHATIKAGFAREMVLKLYYLADGAEAALEILEGALNAPTRG